MEYTLIKMISRSEKEMREDKRIKEWQDKKGIHQFAKNLRRNLPNSEKWFLELYKKEWLEYQLQSNVVIGYYIADFVYRNVIIEIDDPTHLKPEQKIKDNKKDIFYERRGYKVIRIIAWDMESYKQGIKLLDNYFYNNHKVNNSSNSNYKYVKFKKYHNLKSSKRCDGCKKRPKTHRVFWKGRKFYLCSYCYTRNQKLYK